MSQAVDERRIRRLGITSELLASMFLERDKPLVLNPPDGNLGGLEVVGIAIEHEPRMVEPVNGTFWVKVAHPSFSPVADGAEIPSITPWVSTYDDRHEIHVKVS